MTSQDFITNLPINNFHRFADYGDWLDFYSSFYLNRKMVMYSALTAAATGMDSARQTKIFFEEYGEELKTPIGHPNRRYKYLHKNIRRKTYGALQIPNLFENE